MVAFRELCFKKMAMMMMISPSQTDCGTNLRSTWYKSPPPPDNLSNHQEISRGLPHCVDIRHTGTLWMLGVAELLKSTSGQIQDGEGPHFGIFASQ